VDSGNTQKAIWKHSLSFAAWQGLGFKLSEIRALLRLRGIRLQPRAEEKLSDVQRKLADLPKRQSNKMTQMGVERGMDGLPRYCGSNFLS
jgi:DNA-binding transcriptional MerR regulator